MKLDARFPAARSPELFAAATLIVDDLPPARASGILADPRLHATAVAAHLRRRSRSHPWARPRPDRPSTPPVGLPRQDLALSWLAYRRARTTGLGTPIDLLA